MERIPIETVIECWRKINTGYDEGEIFRNLKGLYDRQPLIMAYLRVADKESLNEDEHQILYYSGSFLKVVIDCLDKAMAHP